MADLRRIRDLREDHDYRQTDIADYLHIRQSTYSQYENGQRQPTLDVLIRLAELYDTSLDYLVNRTDERKAYAMKNNSKKL